MKQYSVIIICENHGINHACVDDHHLYLVKWQDTDSCRHYIQVWPQCNMNFVCWETFDQESVCIIVWYFVCSLLHYNLQVILTENCLQKPFSPLLISLSRLITIFKSGAKISVSPHKINSFNTSWTKLYWAYMFQVVGRIVLKHWIQFSH